MIDDLEWLDFDIDDEAEKAYDKQSREFIEGWFEFDDDLEIELSADRKEG